MAKGSWRLARPGSGRARGLAHLPLIIVVVLAVVLILIGKAQSSLFDRARAEVSDWAAPILKVTSAEMDGLNRWLGSVGSIFTIYSDNIRLKEENARLMKWHNSAVVLADRVKRYQLLLHAVHDPALSSEVARVIGRSNHPFVQTMILDAGKSAGVKPGQAVVDDRGMVGRIFLTGERTAWVIPLTDLNSRIPVTIVPGNAQAIMAGNNTRMPAIEVLSHGVDITAGAQVISSGDGDILPAGLPVGVIVAYGHDFRVALFADQSTATDVQILDYKQPMEQPHVPTAGDLPVTAAGLPPAPTPPPVSYATPQGMQTGGAAPLPNGQLKPAQSVSAPVGSPANNAVRVPQAAGKPNVVQSMVGAPAGAKPVVSKPAAVKVTPKVPAKTAPNAADAGDTE